MNFFYDLKFEFLSWNIRTPNTQHRVAAPPKIVLNGKSRGRTQKDSGLC